MSAESVIKYIQTMDLSMIETKMIEGFGWHAREARQANKFYRNYLLLRLKYPDEKLPPSNEVDEFWHNHILDTKKYREDCQAIFGHYFDHYPYFGMDAHSTRQDLELAFEKMQFLHLQEFGYRVTRVRYPKIFSWVFGLIEWMSKSQSNIDLKHSI